MVSLLNRILDGTTSFPVKWFHNLFPQVRAIEGKRYLIYEYERRDPDHHVFFLKFLNLLINFQDQVKVRDPFSPVHLYAKKCSNMLEKNPKCAPM